MSQAHVRISRQGVQVGACAASARLPLVPPSRRPPRSLAAVPCYRWRCGGARRFRWCRLACFSQPSGDQGCDAKEVMGLASPWQQRGLENMLLHPDCA